MATPDKSVTLWFCPACGRQIEGSYDLDTRPNFKCTKRVHSRIAVSRAYVAVDVLRTMLRELDEAEEEPGYAASPDYYAGIGAARDAVEELIEGGKLSNDQ